MRKLASIQRAKEVISHPNADNLDIIKVLGWQVISKKNEFKKGDFLVYFEIDSLLPDEPKYEFLKKTSWNSRYEKIRLKSIRLRGVISQGLALPLTSFPDINWTSYSEGDDLTELFGIEKYEPIIPASLGGDVNKFTWPISKTDEERCIHEDIIISTPKGDFCVKEICSREDIDYVYSYDIIKEKIETKKIVNKTITNNKKNWKKVFFNDGSFIITTDDHKIFLPEFYIYREVKDLKKGDVILSM